MDKAIEVFRHHAIRDMLYITSGFVMASTAVILFWPGFIGAISKTIFHYGGISAWVTAPIVLIVLVIGAVAGLVSQEILAFAGITSTKPLEEYGPIPKLLYHRFNHRAWEWREDQSRPQKVEAARRSIRGDHHLERVINLKQLGTTVGSCLTVIFFLLVIHAGMYRSFDNWPIIIADIFFALSFFAIGRVKLMEEVDFILSSIGSSSTYIVQ